MKRSEKQKRGLLKLYLLSIEDSIVDIREHIKEGDCPFSIEEINQILTLDLVKVLDDKK